MASPIGIIGGSGLGRIPGLAGARRERVASAFGEPSSDVVRGTVEGVEVAFLSRHGEGHTITPAAVNARANIDVLKRLGCRQVVSFSAVGSLREELEPGRLVLVDQYIDRTHGRPSTFFDGAVVAHVAFAEPTCARLRRLATGAAAAEEIPHAGAGTYVVMNGPQFSTRAESVLHQSWGGSVIGMTGLPEAKLAREAELCFLNVAIVTDYDAWHDRHEMVTADLVSETMARIAGQVPRLVGCLLPAMAAHGEGACSEGCDRALDHAVMTEPGVVAAEGGALRQFLERWARAHGVRLV